MLQVYPRELAEFGHRGHVLLAGEDGLKDMPLRYEGYCKPVDTMSFVFLNQHILKGDKTCIQAGLVDENRVPGTAYRTSSAMQCLVMFWYLSTKPEWGFLTERMDNSYQLCRKADSNGRRFAHQHPVLQLVWHNVVDEDGENVALKVVLCSYDPEYRFSRAIQKYISMDPRTKKSVTLKARHELMTAGVTLDISEYLFPFDDQIQHFINMAQSVIIQPASESLMNEFINTGLFYRLPTQKEKEKENFREEPNKVEKNQELENFDLSRVFSEMSCNKSLPNSHSRFHCKADVKYILSGQGFKDGVYLEFPREFNSLAHLVKMTWFMNDTHRQFRGMEFRELQNPEEYFLSRAVLLDSDNRQFREGFKETVYKMKLRDRMEGHDTNTLNLIGMVMKSPEMFSDYESTRVLTEHMADYHRRIEIQLRTRYARDLALYNDRMDQLEKEYEDRGEEMPSQPAFCSFRSFIERNSTDCIAFHHYGETSKVNAWLRYLREALEAVFELRSQYPEAIRLLNSIIGMQDHRKMKLLNVIFTGDPSVGKSVTMLKMREILGDLLKFIDRKSENAFSTAINHDGCGEIYDEANQDFYEPGMKSEGEKTTMQTGKKLSLMNQKKAPDDDARVTRMVEARLKRCVVMNSNHPAHYVNKWEMDKSLQTRFTKSTMQAYNRMNLKLPDDQRTSQAKQHVIDNIRKLLHLANATYVMISLGLFDYIDEKGNVVPFTVSSSRVYDILRKLKKGELDLAFCNVTGITPRHEERLVDQAETGALIRAILECFSFELSVYLDEGKTLPQVEAKKFLKLREIFYLQEHDIVNSFVLERDLFVPTGLAELAVVIKSKGLPKKVIKNTEYFEIPIERIDTQTHEKHEIAILYRLAEYIIANYNEDFVTYSTVSLVTSFAYYFTNRHETFIRTAGPDPNTPKYDKKTTLIYQRLDMNEQRDAPKVYMLAAPIETFFDQMPKSSVPPLDMMKRNMEFYLLDMMKKIVLQNNKVNYVIPLTDRASKIKGSPHSMLRIEEGYRRPGKIGEDSAEHYSKTFRADFETPEQQQKAIDAFQGSKSDMETPSYYEKKHRKSLGLPVTENPKKKARIDNVADVLN